MKNIEQWQPHYFFQDSERLWRIDKRKVYPGSYFVASLQLEAYAPLIEQYITGRVADIGCGHLPYFGMYSAQAEEVICLDGSTDPEVLKHLDYCHDFAEPLPLEKESVDSVLLTDVIGHVRDPFFLIQEINRVLRPGGKLVLTTPHNYWLAAYPNDYYRFSEFALRDVLEKNGFIIIHLESYGGRPDVLLDTLNKSMTGKWSNRVFRLLASLVKKTRTYKRAREKTKYSYPLGYTVVAEKA
jgi:SAM-dependent methyltransferase